MKERGGVGMLHPLKREKKKSQSPLFSRRKHCSVEEFVFVPSLLMNAITQQSHGSALMPQTEQKRKEHPPPPSPTSITIYSA